MQESPSYYSILTADVRYDKRLKNHADCKIIYSEITALSNKNGYCSASNRYFSKLYDRPTPTISKWINLLKELGYLKIEMIYKENSKEIKERHIYPISTPINANVNTYSRRNDEGINADVKTPINVDVKDNITSLNNIKDNTKDKKGKIDFDYKEFIDWFNKLANKSYRDTEQNRKYIKARLNEGYTKEDIAKVVKFKVKEWKDNSDMNKYLRFKTLFAPTHFADYLQEAEDAFEPQEKENKSHSSSQPELSEQEEREKRILMYVEENPEVLTKDTPNNLTIRKEYEKINERNRNKGNNKPTQ